MEELLATIESGKLLALFKDAPFLASFLAGILSFLAPCVLPLVPSYMSYISGLSVKQMARAETLTRRERLKLVGSSVLFVLGFSAVFIAIGVLSDLVVGGERVHFWISRPQVKIGAGIVIVLFGLYFMRVIKAPVLDAERSLRITTKIAFLSPLALGASFALGWTPCVGPIVGTIMMMSLQEGGRGEAIALMSLFSLGLGLPFILLAVLTSWTLNALNKIKRHLRAIEIIGGLLLSAIGATYIYHGVSKLLVS